MGSRIRVLQLVTRLVVRGVPWHVLELAQRLDAARFDVEVMAGVGEPDEGSLWEEFEGRGVRTCRVDCLRRAPNPLADARAYRAIRRHIERGRFDVVHTHISKAGVLGRLAAHRAGTRAIVHTYHGRVGEMTAGRLGRRVFLPLERRAARVSDALIAVSQDMGRYLEDLEIGTPEKRVVIHYGVDLDAFGGAAAGPPAAVAGHPVIGAVGSLTAEKGFDLLLEAVAPMWRGWPELRLCLVGTGPLRAALAGQARRLGIDGGVTFAGAVSDVRPWLRAFDILAVPSRREGMGRVLLEGMAAGVPVVAAKVGGIPEVVTDGVEGLLVPAGDAEALRGALERLLRDGQLRRDAGERGRRTVTARFDLRESVEQTAALYERCLGTKRQTAGSRQDRRRSWCG